MGHCIEAVLENLGESIDPTTNETPFIDASNSVHVIRYVLPYNRAIVEKYPLYPYFLKKNDKDVRITVCCY